MLYQPQNKAFTKKKNIPPANTNATILQTSSERLKRNNLNLTNGK